MYIKLSFCRIQNAPQFGLDGLVQWLGLVLGQDPIHLGPGPLADIGRGCASIDGCGWVNCGIQMSRKCLRVCFWAR